MKILQLIFFSILLSYKVFSYPFISKQEIALGTFVEIKIEKSQGSEKLLERTFQKIKELENKFSIFNPESEISIINKKKKIKISEETKKVIEKAIEISKLTDGAFDITCKPLLDLYKHANKRNFPPSQSEIEKVLKKVGWEKIKIKGNYLFLKEDMELDLGGIAKGFIVDEIVSFLKKEGVKNGIVNAGGDIYCFGLNPEGRKWKIGIRNPREKDKIIEIIKITEKAVATSGDYERYLMIKGKKYGHIVNPKTGKTVEEFPASVTIIASDCTTADGLATGCFVLGAKKGIELLNQLKGIEGIIIDGDMKIYRTIFVNPQ